LLGWSARLNHVADTVTSWTPEMLREAGFEEQCEDIKLAERGSGFWAWKPFIIDTKLREVSDGDIIFYCDVGRLYPFKLLDQPITPYLEWMDRQGQDIMPGVEIPWDGPNSSWIKREALTFMKMDRPEVHTAPPIQASFSLWRASANSRQFASQWLSLCARRALISDDPSQGGLTELPDFRGHRHDQALLTLCCLARRINGLTIASNKPAIDARHPSQVSRLCFGESPRPTTLSCRVLPAVVWPIQKVEHLLRSNIKFGQSMNE
jgi:hypothetical protein